MRIAPRHRPTVLPDTALQRAKKFFEKCAFYPKRIERRCNEVNSAGYLLQSNSARNELTIAREISSCTAKASDKSRSYVSDQT